MEYSPVRVSDIIRQVNRELYLPAIQREFVWGTDRIERLLDSIMADFPIGSFLYWRLEQKNKDEWARYKGSGLVCPGRSGGTVPVTAPRCSVAPASWPRWRGW
jgi:hypothetical protein